MKPGVFLATAAGAATTFALGYLIYGVLLVSYLNEHVIQCAGLNKEPTPDFVRLILSNLVLAFCWRTCSIDGRTFERLPAD